MRLILLGPPGAGKGTQSQTISEQFNIPQLSTGEILRRAVNEKTEIGLKAKSIMDAGELVSDEIVNQIVGERIDEQDCQNGFILDGYPRTLIQADCVEDMLQQRNLFLNAVLSLEVNDEDMVARISGRYTCQACGQGYHDIFHKPKIADVCDKCGKSEFSRRDDDNADLVQSRLQAYYKQTAPLLGYYHAKGILHKIDGMASIEAVKGEIRGILQKIS